MGGNIWKTSVRKDRDDYLNVSSSMENFCSSFLGVKCKVIPAYKNKESFGDCDILVCSDNLPTDWVNRLTDHFELGPAFWSRNGNVVSFLIKDFQYDLILTSEKHFDNALEYYSYNDLGNLVGRLTHKLGIKYGHEGMSIVIRSPDDGQHILGEIPLLSSERVNVRTILGLPRNYEFNDLEDIFKFITLSKYFDPEIFLLDNRSSIAARRDAKRKTYNAFLEWLKETNPAPRYCFANKSERGGYGIREPWFSEIVLHYWPADYVLGEMDKLVTRYNFNKAYREVFNGNIVMEMTGLSGKELGAFIRFIEKDLTNDTKQAWINNPQLAKDAIMRTRINIIMNGPKSLTL